jgi:SAM-dependent methyltransferase
MKMEQVRCNLCGADRSVPYLERGDLSLFLAGRFSLVRCLECGLVYQNPRPAGAELAHIYPDEYDQYTIGLQQEPSPLARLDRLYGLRKRCIAVMRHKAQGRLLDVGCATGDFMDVMRQYPGWEVAGVELSAYASQYAREKLGLDVKTGTLEQAGFSEASFDVITLWDVLEHVPDPLGVLRLSYRLLRPGGVLVINTPNLESLDARLFRAYWIGYELPRHLYVFSRRTMLALLAKAGFRVAETRCLYGSHAAAMTSVSFWLRAKVKDKRRLARLEPVLFARPVRLLTLPYFFVLDRLQLASGLTLFCVRMDAA